jgi:hypothetical protein
LLLDSYKASSGFAIAVKFVATDGSGHPSKCGGSAERWFLYLDCHHEFAIVVHRFGDEKS